MNIMYGSTAYNGIAIEAAGSDPIKTPTGLLVTRSVETQAGWVGQIILDKVIVWESEAFSESDGVKPETLAVRAANTRVVTRLSKLFSG